MKDIPEEIKARLVFRKPTAHEEHILPVVNVKPLPDTQCNDCDETAPHRREFARVTTPFAHWREKCVTCKRYRHHGGTTGWIDDAHGINRIMNSADYRKAHDPRLQADNSQER